MTKLVVLHGALGSHHQFEPLRAALPDVEIDVVSFHGHGSAPDVDAPWTIDLFAEQLREHLREVAGPVPIFGYSMGGYVALRLAMIQPERISKILTLGSKVRWTPEGAAREVKMLNAETIVTKVPAFAADLQRRHGDDHWKTVLSKTADMMITLGDDPVLKPQDLGPITIPVRYGIGDRDEMVTLDETIEFYRATPGAELSVLPATRHPIEKVSMDLLVDQIRRFLLR